VYLAEWVPGSFPVSKAAGMWRWALTHSPPTADIQKKWSLTTTPPCSFKQVQLQLYLYLYLKNTRLDFPRALSYLLSRFSFEFLTSLEYPLFHNIHPHPISFAVLHNILFVWGVELLAPCLTCYVEVNIHQVE